MYRKNKNNPNNIYIAVLALIFVFSFSHLVFASEITESNVLRLVNEARNRSNLAPLVENEKLDSAAKDKLNDMVKNKYFAHTSPAGISPWFWFGKNNYDYKFAGENLAISFLTAENQQKAWMESPTHRKNILNPDYEEIGIAVGAGDISGETSIVVVQEFGARSDYVAPANPEKNFSGTSKENLVEKGTKVGPSVLAVKEAGGTGGGGNNPMPKIDNSSSFENYYSKLVEGLRGNLIDAAPALKIISLLILLLTMLLLPLSFLANALGKMIATSEEGSKESISLTAEDYIRIFASFGDRRNSLYGVKMITIRPG
jgi:hypothetical protein